MVTARQCCLWRPEGHLLDRLKGNISALTQPALSYRYRYNIYKVATDNDHDTDSFSSPNPPPASLIGGFPQLPDPAVVLSSNSNRFPLRTGNITASPLTPQSKRLYAQCL